MKVSNIIAIILGLDLIALLVLGFVESSNIEIIKIFGDVAKTAVGGLVGAIAGEKFDK